jgi:hypothetical protein
MRLSTAKIQNATAQKKTVRLFDGRGLYLEIAPTGETRCASWCFCPCCAG